MNCVIGQTGEPKDIYLFAFRVHAHVLGSVVSGYKVDPVVSLTVQWINILSLFCFGFGAVIPVAVYSFTTYLMLLLKAELFFDNWNF